MPRASSRPTERDPTGRRPAVIHAEDELAAIGMAVGAGWAGARAMTATAGPGISLMTEFVGLAYFAEIPVVIVDVERMGPSTGLPTRTSQGDILKLHLLGHGDCRHIVLIPGSVGECYSLTIEAIDLAQRFQTPVFLATDLDLGMNLWLTDPFPYPEKPLDRGTLPKPVIGRGTGAKGGMICYGSPHPAMIEARDELREQGIETSYCRIRALPVADEVAHFIERHQRVYLVEQNRDGQVYSLL